MQMETKYFFGLGRRKSAVAKVRLYPGRGTIRVNNLDVSKYFNKPFESKYVSAPFDITNLFGKFDISAFVIGGGSSSQLEAVRHGITRALLIYDAGLRHLLRQAGFVTRDPRSKERKKPGLKRARRAPQWSKR
jgi:small subunit ribosomal protein S9